MIKNLMCYIGLVILCISSVQASNKEISIESLLKEMIERKSLAQFPNPAYSCKQFSSYDRATVNPADKSWFANNDRSMFIRLDTTMGRKEYVMMETDGPGAIVRFWMTFAGRGAGNGTLRVYFDNQKEPAIIGRALDIISGGQLVGVPLSTSVSELTDYKMRGHNLYLPLPYARHCKVTYETNNIKDYGAVTGGEAVYYNIDYRTYERSTKVITFSKEELSKNHSLIQQVQRQLQNREVILPDKPLVSLLKGDILPGKEIDKTVTLNNAAIYRLTFDISAQDRAQALRSTILTISFDDQTTVQCPIGDFFGTGYQIRPSSTWYSHVDAEGTMSCYWVMPFQKKCQIRIVNQGTQKVVLNTGEITSAPYKWDNNTLYFGSSWKQYTHLETGGYISSDKDRGPFDLNYIRLTGKGKYVGDVLTLYNTVDAWWGEGDEKIYIDNEKFPSSIGTGTEDYYGYAWSRPERISNHPFLAQPDGSGNFHPGYTVDLRYRSLDAIPFNDSLRFDMEMWHWVNTWMNYAPTTFWYLSPKNLQIPESHLGEARKAVVCHL
jgi:hypothetical protein